MASVKFHAGDFGEGSGSFMFGILSDPHLQTIRLHDLEAVEIASEESVKRIGGTVGWGTVGALALGPVGLLAGLLLGGKAKEVTFVARLKDGRKFLATADSDVFRKLQAAAF